MNILFRFLFRFDERVMNGAHMSWFCHELNIGEKVKDEQENGVLRTNFWMKTVS